MNGEIASGTWFYIIVMIVVIYVGLWMVAGVNPLKVFDQIGQVFEPGKLYITNDKPQEGGLEKLTKLDCTPNSQVVILDGLKFFYRASPGSETDELKFVIIMDYKGLPGTQSKLIVGHHGDNNDEIISCAASGDEFSCPQDIKLRFDMRGIGSLQPKEVFHFTTWLEELGLVGNADSMTLKEMLDQYPQAYLSSFDVAIDTPVACGQHACSSQENEGDCRGATNCYWGGPWYWPWANSCSLCEPFTECSRFGRGACVQCQAAISLNCQPTLTRCA
ncbi:MAG: hypothetical protein J4400_04845 [Candidatus Aenigmarchaeota archaeon]|nr:hypothetical protein [Candidatus Aenigmarchaeota archaeon]